MDEIHLAVGQNHWCHFGVGAPPIFGCFSGDWDVHRGYDLDFDPWPFRTPKKPGRELMFGVWFRSGANGFCPSIVWLVSEIQERSTRFTRSFPNTF